jgi:hypothetical protein
MNEAFSSTNPKNSIGPLSQTGNAAIVGAIIDTQGYASILYAITTGVIVTGGATFAVLLEHGDDAALADAATVTAALGLQGTAALAAFTGAGNQSFKIGAVASKRYSRLTITPTGNTGAALLAAVALLMRPSIAPTPNPPA